MADFNLDYRHHVYQPCLAQVFEALNQLGDSEEDDAHPYNASKWQSYYYQAATMLYDKQYELVSGLGFPQEHIISREYLRSPNATHGPVTLPNINAFAFEEDPLEDYFRDVFVSAKENDERVFLTHLTSTSHHAFKMPEHEQYVPVANGLDMLSHYVNSEGYDDKWLRKVLDLLDEQGVANETLIVFVGDHGLSMPENDVVSPYYNPNVGIDRVPLVFSHPLLPAFDVHNAVHSSQIVPTILDLLVETGSLNKASRQAATDLMRNYEGQSLIRPMQKFNNETGQGNWQFTVVNPGRAVITARDARYPERHLVVPIIDNVEWRLSNLTADPAEHDSVQGFDFISFLDSVERKHGTEVAHWVEEGAFISRWWVEENSKRWRFGAYSDQEP
jgi:arylsulfatase A-like enzyme